MSRHHSGTKTWVTTCSSTPGRLARLVKEVGWLEHAHLIQPSFPRVPPSAARGGRGDMVLAVAFQPANFLDHPDELDWVAARRRPPAVNWPGYFWQPCRPVFALAAERRKVVARGVSPWKTCQIVRVAPAGAAESHRRAPAAPPGLRAFLFRLPGAHAPGYCLPSLRDWSLCWVTRCATFA